MFMVSMNIYLVSMVASTLDRYTSLLDVLLIDFLVSLHGGW